ncbi:MAG: 50S ribosomal protein L13 [Candidatus Babeliales bacterium]
MNKAFFLKKEDEKPNWVVIDAKDQVLGRLATRVADILRGKNRPQYTPHADAGDYVVIINAQDIVLTGNKWNDKMYVTYSGYFGGKKETSARDLNAKHPTRVIELAVERMLPKNRLSRQLMRKLRIYTGSEHPHEAQVSTSAKAA